jgi:hypothetical protein
MSVCARVCVCWCDIHRATAQERRAVFKKKAAVKKIVPNEIHKVVCGVQDDSIGHNSSSILITLPRCFCLKSPDKLRTINLRVRRGSFVGLLLSKMIS